MNKLVEEFTLFLEKAKEDCQRREAELKAGDRKDEANLCKVEANIYDIFKILFETSVREADKKQLPKEERLPEILRIFREKAERIPQNWKISYEKAKAHEDVEKILIEETKLEVVEKIMKVLEQEERK